MGVVAVSLCSDQALAFCRAVKEADGRFHIEFEHVTVEGPAIDEKTLLQALNSAASISTRCRLVAVPHPGFNYDTARCQQQMMLEEALESYLPDGGCVMRVRLVDRVEACQAVSRRPIKEEALTVVTGGKLSLRPEAEQYKTSLNGELYLLQTEYMRQEATKLLQDPTKCSNPEEAFAAYTAVSSHPGAFVHVADALWNAVSEARNSVSAGYKRSRAVGAFFYSDSYWGYEWSEDEGGQKGEDQDEEDEEELGEGAGKVQQQLELVAQREHRAVRLKRQHRPAGMAT